MSIALRHSRLKLPCFGSVMKKFFQSLTTLDGWVDFFDNLRELIIILYLVDLLENRHYIGFILVIIIFGFKPLVGLSRSRSNPKS